MEFFRGFVRTKGKKSIDPFKNDSPLRNFEQIQKCDEYAGVLASDTVLIDIDDERQAEKLLEIVEAKELMCQVRKTSRGMHFYFKNDGGFTKCATGVTLGIGIKADIKIGTAASYAVLKHGGEERKVVYDIFEDENYGVAPKWLRPVASKMDLCNLGEGEGRNSSMFGFILPLQQAGFSKAEIVETLRVVNDYVFDEPLSENEFETITRDDAFKKKLVPTFYTEDGGFMFNEFAHYMVNEFKIKRVNGSLCMFDGRVYVSGDGAIEAKMIEVIPKLSARHRVEALKYIGLLLLENSEMAGVNLIAFNNGVYNLDTGLMEEFSHDVVLTNLIPHNYNDGAYSEVVDRTLDKMACGNPEIRSLMEELVGYCFFRRNELRKAFILTGEKSNGKSTFIHMIDKMLGEDNCCAMDLKDLSDRFKTIEVFGKLANLGDDINDEFIKDVSIFKKMVSGEALIAEKKGKDPIRFSPYAKLIFSANNLPKMRDKTGAVMDRLVIVPFNATFSRDDADFDPFIKDKLVSEGSLEYLIRLGMEGLKRVLGRMKFTECAEVAAEIEEYNKMNNPILDFWEGIEVEEVLRESVADWYMKYHEFCLASNLQTMSRIEFTRQTRKVFDGLDVKQIRVAGGRERFFCLR